MAADTIDMEYDENNDNSYDKELFNVISPVRYEQNFPNIKLFEKYIKGYIEQYDVLSLVPTLRRALKSYEEWEAYEQCSIIKEVINEIIEKRKNKKII